ncbi:MAG TPA: secretin N-terminal domain-containing protein [Thermoanaerobaculia bacterium]
MNRLKITAAALVLTLPLTFSCASYNSYQKARTAETTNDWDTAVVEYEKALEISPENREYQIALARARREASRAHFEKGKSLYGAAEKATGDEQFRLAQMAATELELTIKLDPTNQYAAVQYGKAVNMMQQIRNAANQSLSVDEMKKRVKANTTGKAQPPTLNPASDDPISLSFPRETPVKDIYRALGNAFGINVLFDQAVKDDRITIELRDVTAQAALERVMQAANHFYKVLDEKTIIVVPDNPQARRDYEDLVIRTFYLSNGDAEQVTNVVRTMIEARNVFPLKALNAITIRDTADKVRIAEKIIEANDKAKAEVVVQVELLQLDANKSQEIGAFVAGLTSDGAGVAVREGVKDGATVLTPIGSGTVNSIRPLGIGSYTFNIPTISYAFVKGLGKSETLANPELRISEGEKATLHIGRRVPVPVSTFPTLNTGTGGGAYGNVTSYQYQDVGIKVAIEPRVHHNREVTLKLTVEVSDVGESAEADDSGQQLPTFNTRTIEATIRLKDGETNFLAGLIQESNTNADQKTPFLGDIPFIGRLFTKNRKSHLRTDLMLTMTPHIIRIPDITEEDLAPMWVGTTNNLTFRGVSPRIESQSGTDPFAAPARGNQFNPATAGMPLASDGEPGNYVIPDGLNPNTSAPSTVAPGSGGAPNDPFRRTPGQPGQPQPQPQPVPPPNPEANSDRQGNSPLSKSASAAATVIPTTAAPEELPREAALRLSPRLAPQPSAVTIKPGDSRMWSVVGMDLDGLTATQLLFHYDPRSLDVTDVVFGSAIAFDPQKPPVVTINRDTGTIKIMSSDKLPLRFASGGDVVSFRVHGGLMGETFLVLEPPDFRSAAGGEQVFAAVSGGKARVE